MWPFWWGEEMAKTTHRDDKPSSAKSIPAVDTPPLAPWNGFDHAATTRLAAMCRRLAEIVADDEWHDWRTLINEVAPEAMDLQDRTLERAIRQMAARGDLRIWRKNEYARSVRLAGRWQGYRKDICPECGTGT